MTLQEAINLTHDVAVDEFKPLTDLERKALKLGIEALKYVYGRYDPDHQMMRRLLPGETLE